MHTGHNGHEVSIRYFHGGIAGDHRPADDGELDRLRPGQRVAQNLPAYMVLSDPGGPPGRRHAQLVERVHAAALPGDRAPAAGAADPQPRPAAAAPRRRRSGRTSRFLDRLNRRHLEQHPGEADLEVRIASYELAAAMQTAAKEALDVSQRAGVHPATVRPRPTDATREYGTRCLIARRLVERGVRFVQLFLGGQPWDNHNTIRSGLPAICRRTDRPAAALVQDLKQRGLLDTTLVHWGGEIGRLPVCEGEPRRQAPAATTTARASRSGWPAAASRAGMTYGATDEVGHQAVENVVTPNDFQATILHLLGLDHDKLVYHANGREQRLTDGRPARVVKEILA